MRNVERVAVGLAGLLLRQIDRFVPKRADAWVFGALSGERFVDNTKYLYLYALQHAEPQYRVTWITRSRRVLRSLRAQGLPCEHNYSPRGVWCVLRASVRAISTRRADVLFFYPRRGRSSFHLHHGMPIKRIGVHYRHWLAARASILDRLWTRYAVGCAWEEMDAVLSTSDFYDRTLREALGIRCGFVTGQPRTDVLRAPERFSAPSEAQLRERWGLHARLIAIYLPTHRQFGVGDQPGVPFAREPAARRRLQQAGMQIAVKLHPEAIRPARLEDDTIVDVSTLCEDPQDLLRIASCLITDYSSVFVDYLLLDRPIVFHLYDEAHYITTDNEVYFRLADKPVGRITRSETELLDALLQVAAGADPQRDERSRWLPFFHAHVDDGACERAWHELTGLARRDPSHPR